MTMTSNHQDATRAEVAGVEAIVTTIHEPMRRRAYEMRMTFHFCVAVPLGRLLRSGSRGA
jgi:hypothetical protein